MFRDGLFRERLFAGQRVLVTGGGSGLGRAMAERLLGLGAEIHICGRRPSVLEETAADLMATHGGNVGWHVLDIRDPEAVDATVQAIWDSHGPVTALVNNAAGNFVSRTEDMSYRGFNAIADIVFRGTFYVTQAVGKRWIAGDIPGSVVSIVVTWVWTGSPFVVPSAMSKAGIDAMTKSLAIEWGRHGIRLNAIAPGTIPTEGMTKRLRPGDDGHTGEAERNPMRRIGTTDDLGNLAAFLLAPENGWLTGTTIALDGGNWLAHGGGFEQCFEWDDADWAEARDRIKAQNARDKAQRGS